MDFVPSHVLGSPAAQQNIPCWPNHSELTILLTRDIDRVTHDPSYQLPFVFALMFIFDDFVGRVLHLIGYENLILLRAQYFYLSARLEDIRFVDFQVLEVTIWLSIAIWGVRLLLGIFFLKQYDKFFLLFVNPHQGRVYGAFVLGLFGLYVASSVDWHFTTKEILPLMKYLPRAYFVFVSILWCWSILLISASALFIVWKLFRQHWPGVHLWHESAQNGGLQTPAN